MQKATQKVSPIFHQDMNDVMKKHKMQKEKGPLNIFQQSPKLTPHTYADSDRPFCRWH